MHNAAAVTFPVAKRPNVPISTRVVHLAVSMTLALMPITSINAARLKPIRSLAMSLGIAPMTFVGLAIRERVTTVAVAAVKERFTGVVGPALIDLLDMPQYWVPALDLVKVRHVTARASRGRAPAMMVDKARGVSLHDLPLRSAHPSLESPGSTAARHHPHARMLESKHVPELMRERPSAHRSTVEGEAIVRPARRRDPRAGATIEDKMRHDGNVHAGALGERISNLRVVRAHMGSLALLHEEAHTSLRKPVVGAIDHGLQHRAASGRVAALRAGRSAVEDMKRDRDLLGARGGMAP